MANLVASKMRLRLRACSTILQNLRSTYAKDVVGHLRRAVDEANQHWPGKAKLEEMCVSQWAPEEIKQRIFEQPEEFKQLAQDNKTLLSRILAVAGVYIDDPSIPDVCRDCRGALGDINNYIGTVSVLNTILVKQLIKSKY